MCAHTVCKVTLPRIPQRNCDASFITEVGCCSLKGIAPVLFFTLCLENSWEKWANSCPFSVFFVEKLVYYQ